MDGLFILFPFCSHFVPFYSFLFLFPFFCPPKTRALSRKSRSLYWKNARSGRVCFAGKEKGTKTTATRLQEFSINALIGIVLVAASCSVYMVYLRTCFCTCFCVALYQVCMHLMDLMHRMDLVDRIGLVDLMGLMDLSI